MGSKRLKGIVVAGSGKVEPIDQDGFKTVRRTIFERVKAYSKWAADRRQYRTGANLEVANKVGIIPTRNWQAGQFEDWPGICTRTMVEGRRRRNIACGP